jgi:hypothetical protein
MEAALLRAHAEARARVFARVARTTAPRGLASRGGMCRSTLREDWLTPSARATMSADELQDTLGAVVLNDLLLSDLYTSEGSIHMHATEEALYAQDDVAVEANILGSKEYYDNRVEEDAGDADAGRIAAYLQRVREVGAFAFLLSRDLANDAPRRLVRYLEPPNVLEGVARYVDARLAPGTVAKNNDARLLASLGDLEYATGRYALQNTALAMIAEPAQPDAVMRMLVHAVRFGQREFFTWLVAQMAQTPDMGLLVPRDDVIGAGQYGYQAVSAGLHSDVFVADFLAESQRRQNMNHPVVAYEMDVRTLHDANAWDMRVFVRVFADSQLLAPDMDARQALAIRIFRSLDTDRLAAVVAAFAAAHTPFEQFVPQRALTEDARVPRRAYHVFIGALRHFSDAWLAQVTAEQAYDALSRHYSHAPQPGIPAMLFAVDEVRLARNRLGPRFVQRRVLEGALRADWMPNFLRRSAPDTLTPWLHLVRHVFQSEGASLVRLLSRPTPPSPTIDELKLVMALLAVRDTRALLFDRLATTRRSPTWLSPGLVRTIALADYSTPRGVMVQVLRGVARVLYAGVPPPPDDILRVADTYGTAPWITAFRTAFPSVRLNRDEYIEAFFVPDDPSGFVNDVYEALISGSLPIDGRVLYRMLSTDEYTTDENRRRDVNYMLAARDASSGAFVINGATIENVVADHEGSLPRDLTHLLFEAYHARAGARDAAAGGAPPGDTAAKKRLHNRAREALA